MGKTLIALFICLFALSANAETITGKVAQYVDADTIDIDGKRIRLAGIDAPEKNQRCYLPDEPYSYAYYCGRRSTVALRQKVNNRPVRCEIDTEAKDSYGRLVGTCYKRDINLNKWLVRNGWANAYTKFSLEYKDDEIHAREGELGNQHSEYVAPEQWRRRVRHELKDVLPVCKIRGNISRSGEKIAHVYGGRSFKRTLIEEQKGERMLCGAEDLAEYGWRLSK